MTEGKEMLTFPGPGGYKVEWSPGTVHVPLQTAPSGHLVFVVDAFGKISTRTGGMVPQSFTLHTHVAATSDPGTLASSTPGGTSEPATTGATSSTDALPTSSL